jgi:hypothetical protein
MFLVQDVMQAQKLTQFLDVGNLIVAPEPAGPSLPITPDGTLAAGTFYPDETSTTRQWYLPVYALNVADGRYTTTLKWRGPNDDPNGPLAYLDVQLAAPVPPGAGADVAEISHTAVVRIAYELPVQGGQTGGATLWYEVGALGVNADGVRACRVPVMTKPDFDRLYAVMTDPVMNGRLEIHCAATLGRKVTHPTWQFVEPEVVIKQPWLNAIDRRPPILEPFAPPTGTVPPEVVQPVTPSVVEPEPQIHEIKTLPQFTRLARDSAVVRRAQLRGLKADPHVAAARLRRRPGDDEVVLPRRPVDDEGKVWIDPDLIDRPVDWTRWHHGPVRTGTETEVVQVSLETVQTLPFSFPVATNAYMFDIPGDLRPTTNEILIPNTVIVDGAVTTFYEDSAYPGRYYFAPQELRLSRADAPPYLPRLVFAFDLQHPADAAADAGVDASAAAGTAAGGDAMEYDVRVAFVATPWISPLTLAEIRQQVPATTDPPEFLPLAPVSANLSLQLPVDAGGAVAPAPQPDATVNFEQGVTDEFRLTPEQFKAFVASLTATGVDGTVSTTLVGSTMKEVRLTLSFARTAGHLFSRQLTPTGTAGEYRVTLTNDVESAVTLHAAHVVLVSPGVVALPDDFDTTSVAPGASFDLTYHVQPADALVVDIEPDVDATVDVDPAKLLPRLMVAEGYRNDTFTVPVSAAPTYFATPGPNGAMLAGLVVDFDSGVEIAFDATHVEAQAELHMPWLPYLLDAPEAKQYRYRVTNVWAAEPAPRADPPGDWIDGAGEAALAVVPNQPVPA